MGFPILGVALVVAFAAAAVMPRDVAALGMLVLGPLHVVCELTIVRRVVPVPFSVRWWPLWALAAICALGRFLGHGVFLEALVFTVLAIVGLRWPTIARWFRFSTFDPGAASGSDEAGRSRVNAVTPPVRPRARAIAVLALLTVCIVGGFAPAWWLVAVAHLHNMLPVALATTSLWRAGRRRAASAVFGGYAVAIGLLLGGAMDRAILARWAHPLTSSGAATGLGSAVHGAFGAHVSDVMATRIVSAFVFGQLAHYAIWIAALRTVSATSTARRDPTRIPTTATAIMTGVVLLAIAQSDLALARRMYTSAAVIHVIVELPVLAALFGASASLHRNAPKRRSDREWTRMHQ